MRLSDGVTESKTRYVIKIKRFYLTFYLDEERKEEPGNAKDK